jgi:hypothetical protein
MAAPTSCLTRCPGHGDIESSRYAYRAGPRTLANSGAIGAISKALFHARRSTMAAGVGILRDGRSLSPVLATRTSPPPKPLTEVADSNITQESNMSHDNTPGVSAETTYRYISLDTAVKRARRHLAKTGAKLIKSKPATKSWRELGDFSIRDASGEVVMKSVNLRAMMQTAKILADHERIELPNQPGWRYYVARQVSVQIDGATHYRNEPLSKLYFTEKQAIQAAESITDRDGIVVVGFNAAGGTTHGDL